LAEGRGLMVRVKMKKGEEQEAEGRVKDRKRSMEGGRKINLGFVIAP